MNDSWKKNITQGEDGVFLFWPTDNQGAYPAHVLRAIAIYLDELNNKKSE